ncbi:uncharacterized protein LOC128215796 [Mya arenaria]|uniref:uncharacterized protein LOC128215796 n=1 Tax=Mya arenaria TaxID=6604 RepID=UPI0022E3F000|nr:uncharacterized protein LOC128215796 [Mya arenaria]
METEDQEESDWQPVKPQTLIQGLKCPVCWDYFVNPHTLPCGHTFCVRCLQSLARLTRSSRTRTPLDRLRLRCPSCRRNALARPFLRRRASVNYAIKGLVDEWFNSPYFSGSVDFIQLRSVSCQTEHDVVNEAIDDVKEEVKEDDPDKSITLLSSRTDVISSTEFRQVLFHRIGSKASIDSERKGQLHVEETPSDDVDNAVSDVTATSSDESEESENEIAELFGDIQVVNVEHAPFRRLRRFDVASIANVLKLFFGEIKHIFIAIRSSRSRTLLTIFWFLYGGLIVSISRIFLPWMAFYTLIYFVIIYAEITPP